MSVTRLELFIIVFAVIGSISVFILSAKDYKLQRYCLSKGYPQSSYNIIGPSYCIKRINQTDVVISESELK